MSKTPLIPDQKPLKFIEELIKLFSLKGDWILDGFGGLGKFWYKSKVLMREF